MLETKLEELKAELSELRAVIVEQLRHVLADLHQERPFPHREQARQGAPQKADVGRTFAPFGETSEAIRRRR